MNLTTFQRIVLLALASLVSNRAMAKMMKKIALGHHTDDQAESEFNQWLSDER